MRKIPGQEYLSTEESRLYHHIPRHPVLIYSALQNALEHANDLNSYKNIKQNGNARGYGYLHVMPLTDTYRPYGMVKHIYHIHNRCNI